MGTGAAGSILRGPRWPRSPLTAVNCAVAPEPARRQQDPLPDSPTRLLADTPIPPASPTRRAPPPGSPTSMRCSSGAPTASGRSSTSSELRSRPEPTVAPACGRTTLERRPPNTWCSRPEPTFAPAYARTTFEHPRPANRCRHMLTGPSVPHFDVRARLEWVQMTPNACAPTPFDARYPSRVGAWHAMLEGGVASNHVDARACEVVCPHSRRARTTADACGGAAGGHAISWRGGRSPETSCVHGAARCRDRREGWRQHARRRSGPWDRLRREPIGLMGGRDRPWGWRAPC